MRIHSDTLELRHLQRAALSRDGLYPELSEHGSRKRRRAFELSINAEPGEDAHEIERIFSRNSGTLGAANGYGRAATWIEWGDIIAELFKLDPEAIVGPYDGREDFVAQTTRAAEHRPARENAKKHAHRWREELWEER